jgi:mitotic spindle assembly checkpoint protein MAD2
MSTTQQAVASNTITLRGSTEIVTEFFNYGVNNVLYQRGVYPPESFKRVPKYGISMVETIEEGLKTYLANILRQLHDWLMGGKVQKLVLVVKGIETGDILERWVFDCEATDGANDENTNTQGQRQTNSSTKSHKEITQEIQAIMRQITASVTFLPLLNESCSFDLLVYADKDATVPLAWEDSDPCMIKNAEEVQLRSFSTKLHKVDLKVSYKVDEDAI